MCPWKCIQLKIATLGSQPSHVLSPMISLHLSDRPGFIHRNHQLWSCNTQPLRLYPCSPTPRSWSPKSELQPSALAHTDRYMSQAGELPCVQVSLHSVCCKPVVFSSVAPHHHLSQLISSRAGASPGVGTFLCFRVLHQGRSPVPISFFLFLLSYLVTWIFTCSFRNLRSSSSIQYVILWESFQMLTYFWCICGREAPHPTTLLSWLLPLEVDTHIIPFLKYGGWDPYYIIILPKAKQGVSHQRTSKSKQNSTDPAFFINMFNTSNILLIREKF